MLEDLTGRRSKFAALYGFSMIVGAALIYQTYALTHSRPAEFSVAFLGVAPVVMFMMCRGSLLDPPLTTYEAGVARATAWILALSIPIYVLLLVFQLIGREQSGNLELGRNWVIAGALLIIPIQAFSAYLMRQRWRKSRTASPPSFAARRT